MTTFTKRQVALSVVLASVLMLGNGAGVQAGETVRVSVDSTGAQSNSFSRSPTLSTNGQVVAFESDASNLVAGDTNEATDIFVHNLKTGETVRVSVDSIGAQGNNISFNPALSANGQIVAFVSLATNLVAGGTNRTFGIFVHNLKTRKTELVSVDSTGAQGNNVSRSPILSANGQIVAFESFATNLVADDTNSVGDIFVHNLKTGETVRVSVDSTGTQSNRASFKPVLSATGQVVAFESTATNLVTGDTNGVSDIFVHDLKTGVTKRVSVDSLGTQSNGESAQLQLSANGQVVAFTSTATNLVPGDTNGAFDVFVHNLKTGETERVSVDSTGAQSNINSFNPALSANGQVVAFVSFGGILGGSADIFAHNVKTGKTELVSVDSTGAQGNDFSDSPVLSGSGRVVAFESFSTNLVAGDTNEAPDIFVHVQ